jgi:hypothetical protein
MHQISEEVRAVAATQNYVARSQSESPNPTVGEVLREIATDAAALARDEVALVLTDIRDRARTVITAFAIGIATGLAALLVFCAGAWVVLAREIGDWQASLLLGGVMTMVSVVSLLIAVKRLKRSRLGTHRRA